MIKKIFRMIGIIAGSSVVLALIGITLFVSCAPQFGAKPKGEYLKRIESSENYEDKKFQNREETKLDYSLSNIVAMIRDLTTAKNTEPDDPLPVKFGENTKPTIDSTMYITWYGHSTFLIEMEEKKFMIDPMLGDHASPVSFYGKRFPYEKPIDVENITELDAILISHDHYDHLDYFSITELMGRTKKFFVPLGVGSHLRHWGVPEEKIVELDWWESRDYMDIHFVAVPARHFSGRGIMDGNKTQWAGWVIQGKYENLYFTGDGGYSDEFKKVGEKYGPFDLALIECGQYNTKWSDIHMMPEESVQAGIDAGARIIMPVHWSAFDLAPHRWTEPIERFLAEAKKQDIKAIHPYIGERFGLRDSISAVNWWK